MAEAVDQPQETPQQKCCPLARWRICGRDGRVCWTFVLRRDVLSRKKCCDVVRKAGRGLGECVRSNGGTLRTYLVWAFP